VTRSAPRGGAPGAPGAGVPGAGRGKVVGEETAALALLLLDHDKPVRPLLHPEYNTVGPQECTYPAFKSGRRNTAPGQSLFFGLPVNGKSRVSLLVSSKQVPQALPELLCLSLAVQTHMHGL